MHEQIDSWDQRSIKSHISRENKKILPSVPNNQYGKQERIAQRSGDYKDPTEQRQIDFTSLALFTPFYPASDRKNSKTTTQDAVGENPAARDWLVQSLLLWENPVARDSSVRPLLPWENLAAMDWLVQPLLPWENLVAMDWLVQPLLPWENLVAKDSSVRRLLPWENPVARDWSARRRRHEVSAKAKAYFERP
jgi:hypothetical protein